MSSRMISNRNCSLTFLRMKHVKFKPGSFWFTHCIRYKSVTGYENVDKALVTMTAGRINGWVDAYEDFFGLAEVREAQKQVTEAENQYRSIQEERRNTQEQLSNIQSKMKLISADIEKTSRGTDTYLNLITKENEIIREEMQVTERYKVMEDKEKQSFSGLSSALRESHEKERARTERMKYWGIVGSVVGAVLGMVGTAVNNKLRMKELRNIISTSSDTSELYRDQTVKLSALLNKQYEQLDVFLGDLRSTLDQPAGSLKVMPSKNVPNSKQVDGKMDEVLTVLKRQEVLLEKEMKEIRQLLVTGNVSHDGSVVYVGQEVQEMLKDSERNLEWKMKVQSIGTVTFIYAAMAVAIPVAYLIFKGGGG